MINQVFNYQKKARKLLKAGFWVAGRGHFDITEEELDKILELVEKNDFKSIASLYKKLAEERL